MTSSLKRNTFLQKFSAINHDAIKFQVPLILRMYGALNIVNLKTENRYILCNFIDQNSDLFDIAEDIYISNNNKGLNQLFLLALNKAKEFNLLTELYEEYLNSYKAISQKKEFKSSLFK